MSNRTIEDQLREEYFDLLPEIRRVSQRLEAEVHYHTRDVLNKLRPHEQLIVRSRVKECESALKTLRGKSDGRVFDPDRSDLYSVSHLPDLAGVRVLAFPNACVERVNAALKPFFPDWRYDPVSDGFGTNLAHKYDGYLVDVSSRVRAEYQVVPMFLGLFWEVEHSAMYKSELVANSKNMQKRRAAVEAALSDFEKGIANLLPSDSHVDTGDQE